MVAVANLCSCFFFLDEAEGRDDGDWDAAVEQIAGDLVVGEGRGGGAKARRVLSGPMRPQALMSSASDVASVSYSALMNRHRRCPYSSVLRSAFSDAASVVQFDMSSPMYLTPDISNKNGSRSCAVKPTDSSARAP